MLINNWISDLQHLIYPQFCHGCGTDAVSEREILCINCLQKLPETNFFITKDNLVEKKLLASLLIELGGSAYFFTKESILEKLMYDLKYHDGKKCGNYLGKMTGQLMQQASWANEIDLIIPMPMHKSKEFKRGYNQALSIAEGMSEILGKPANGNAVTRLKNTETQTHKGRIDRILSLEDIFKVNKPEILQGKHILLVDDVVTTGSSIDSCGNELLKIDGTKISIATVGCTIS